MLRIHLHICSRVVKLSLSDLDGQSTFGMQDSDDTNETFVDLEIKKASEEILTVSQKSAGTIDLLHVNCEGCEWEMLEDIIESGHHKNIRLSFYILHHFIKMFKV